MVPSSRQNLWTIPECFSTKVNQIHAIKYFGKGLILITFKTDKMFDDLLYDSELQTIVKLKTRKGNFWPNQNQNIIDKDEDYSERREFYDVDQMIRRCAQKKRSKKAG